MTHLGREIYKYGAPLELQSLSQYVKEHYVV